MVALFRDTALAGRPHSLTRGVAAAALAALLAPGVALAQAGPEASAETLRQMRQELDALRAEEAAAKAAEEAAAQAKEQAPIP